MAPGLTGRRLPVKSLRGLLGARDGRRNVAPASPRVVVSVVAALAVGPSAEPAALHRVELADGLLHAALTALLLRLDVRRPRIARVAERLVDDWPFAHIKFLGSRPCAEMPFHRRAASDPHVCCAKIT